MHAMTVVAMCSEESLIGEEGKMWVVSIEKKGLISWASAPADRFSFPEFCRSVESDEHRENLRFCKL